MGSILPQPDERVPRDGPTGGHDGSPGTEPQVRAMLAGRTGSTLEFRPGTRMLNPGLETPRRPGRVAPIV
ncbi:hypothetical protein CCE01nite_18070 [Cellulomonas cellasea]|uniref:Uncharacterized protein n=1 Tax=Cellulomonas cellasea TaxID=43670 RepID=A0A4Y3KYF4_9CELL|nr:hypothetical protein CCE01nite_18070 [Cellulomonas cellasea]